MRNAHYGFKNFHYCPRGLGAVPRAMPGAVRLTRAPDMQEIKVRPDTHGIPAEYTAGYRDRGIKLGLEIVSLPVQFLVDVLGYVQEASGVLVEGKHPAVHFALLYETRSLAGPVRHCYYDCVCQKPKFDATTLSASSRFDTRILELTVNRDIFGSGGYKESIARADNAEMFDEWFERRR